MKKIVFGIVVMAVLLGGLGVGFVAGYEYKCMKEGRDLALINRHIECQCYYAGDIDSFGWCLDECVDDKLEMMSEYYKETSGSYDEGYKDGYFDGYDEGMEVTCGMIKWCEGYLRIHGSEADPIVIDICEDLSPEFLENIVKTIGQDIQKCWRMLPIYEGAVVVGVEWSGEIK